MIHSVKEIATMLAGQAESVCAHLLPGGKRNGAEWEAGSIAGEKGKSLKVRLTGDRAGVWCDFAGGDESGDLLDLWAASRNIKLADAIQEAKKWLNISEPTHEPQKKSYAKPVKKEILSLGNDAQEYLMQERGLEKEILIRFKIGETKDGKYLSLPSYNPAGEILNVKYLGIARDKDGKKDIRTEGGCAPSLFGWQAFKGGRILTITEGEIDAMTMTQYGHAALSVPFGAGKKNKNEWIDFEWENLEQFETIFLCYDNDEAGQGCVEEVARRLGIHRCRSIKLPFKDPNECLQKGVDAFEIQECYREAISFEPPEIRQPIAFLDRVTEYFHPASGTEVGFKPAMFGGKITFRPGELTLWTGCNSHGKSSALGQIAIAAAVLDQRTAIASMEMRAEKTLGRLLRQFWVEKCPTKGEIERGLAWMTGKIWIYDLMGNVPRLKLLELLEYTVRRYQVFHFVIDSLMKCDIDGDDHNAQRRFLNDAVTFANRNLCHVHLVAHPRKHDEARPVDRSGISGTGDIPNQADNVLSWWRNKAKERGKKTEMWTEADAICMVDKQRETGWEGDIHLSFHKFCEQYSQPDKAPMEYWKLAKQTQDPHVPNDVPPQGEIPL